MGGDLKKRIYLVTTAQGLPVTISSMLVELSPVIDYSSNTKKETIKKEQIKCIFIHVYWVDW